MDGSTAPESLSTEGVMAGDPCAAGTRIPLAVVDIYMRDGCLKAELLTDYSGLSAGVYYAVRRYRE